MEKTLELSDHDLLLIWRGLRELSKRAGYQDQSIENLIVRVWYEYDQRLERADRAQYVEQCAAAAIRMGDDNASEWAAYARGLRDRDSVSRRGNR